MFRNDLSKCDYTQIPRKTFSLRRRVTVYGWILASDIRRLQKALDECAEPAKRGELEELLEDKLVQLEERLLAHN